MAAIVPPRQRGVNQQPELPEVHFAVGFYHLHDFNASNKALRVAIRLTLPNCTSTCVHVNQPVAGHVHATSSL